MIIGRFFVECEDFVCLFLEAFLVLLLICFFVKAFFVFLLILNPR